MAPTHAQLASLSDDELVARYDGHAQHTIVGTAFYREELTRRLLARESGRTLALTKTMARLTWAILVLTAINVLVVLYPLVKA
jgi:hypothetical protein